MLSPTQPRLLSSYCTGLSNGASPLLCAPDAATALLLLLPAIWRLPLIFLAQRFLNERRRRQTCCFVCWSQRHFFWLSNGRRGSRVWKDSCVFCLFLLTGAVRSVREGETARPLCSPHARATSVMLVDAALVMGTELCAETPQVNIKATAHISGSYNICIDLLICASNRIPSVVRCSGAYFLFPPAWTM